MGEGNLSCTASCLLLKHKLLFHWKSEGKRLVQPKGKLTGKDGEDAWDRRHIYPALAVFIETSRSLLPIGKVFISIRGANKKTCRHVSPKMSMVSTEGSREYSLHSHLQRRLEQRLPKDHSRCESQYHGPPFLCHLYGSSLGICTSFR